MPGRKAYVLPPGVKEVRTGKSYGIVGAPPLKPLVPPPGSKAGNGTALGIVGAPLLPDISIPRRRLS
jgi:hypothetical protein